MAKKDMTDEELEALFKKIDKNKSGTITKDELEKFLQKVGKQSKADSKKSAKSMMIHDDTNRDGEITLEEFIAACRSR